MDCVPQTVGSRGEIVVNEHDLESVDGSYQGKDSLIVGSCNAVDMRGGSVDEISQDHVTLPDKVYVEPAD